MVVQRAGCGRCAERQDDYTKNRNYWKYLKNKLKESAPQLVRATNQLKIKAADGKAYTTDVLDASGIVELAKSMPNNKAAGFIEWFTNGENTLDGKSKEKAYSLFESSLLCDTKLRKECNLLEMSVG